MRICQALSIIFNHEEPILLLIVMLKIKEKKWTLKNKKLIMVYIPYGILCIAITIVIMNGFKKVRENKMTLPGYQEL